MESLTENQIDQIVSLYNSGLTIYEVADRLHCGVSSVNKYLRERSVERRKGGPRKQELLRDRLEIRSRYEAHETAQAIAYDFGVSKPTILKILRSQGTRIRDCSECQQKHTCNYHYFENVKTEEQAYWLGLFAADGAIRPPNIIALELKVSDGNLVRLFANHLNTSVPVNDRMDRDYPMTSIAFRSTKMTSDLKNYGIVPNKEQIITWPNLPENLYRHYLRGEIDGDGSFPEPQHSPKRNQLSIQIASSLCYIEECQRFLIDTFGFGRTEIEHRGSKQGIYVLRYSGNRQLLSFVNWLYEDATIYLDRKRQLVLDHYQSLPKYRDQLRFG